jgi:hypothetical protein
LGKADLKSGNEVTPGHVSSFGVPMILHIRSREQNYKHTLYTIYLFVTSLFGNKNILAALHRLQYQQYNGP